jgi:hypothetical protein
VNVDILRIERESVKFPDGKTFVCARILINDIPLRDMVREYELPFARKCNQESIAGSYVSALAIDLYDLLTGKEKLSKSNGAIPVLTCVCGCVGCWDLLVEVEENDSQVIWKNIHNPHRSSPTSPRGFWDYGNFPTFHFHKEQYADVIDQLRGFAVHDLSIPKLFYPRPQRINRRTGIGPYRRLQLNAVNPVSERE